MKARTVGALVVMVVVVVVALLAWTTVRVEARQGNACPDFGLCFGDFLIVQSTPGVGTHCIAAPGIGLHIAQGLVQWHDPSTETLIRIHAPLAWAKVPRGVRVEDVAVVLGTDINACRQMRR